MNRTGRIIFASLIAAIGLGAVSPALAYDPTRSRWYRATQWVDPTYRAMNRIMRTPPRFVPRSFRLHYRAFRGGWNAGRHIERRFHTGNHLYRYLNQHTTRCQPFSRSPFHVKDQDLI